MIRAKGFQGRIGLKKAPVWGIAAAAGPGDGLEVESFSVEGGAEEIPDMQLTGKVTTWAGSPGAHKIEVTLTSQLRYEGFEVLLALFYGKSNGVPVVEDTDARRIILRPEDDIDGIFCTVAYDFLKAVKVAELPAVKWTGLKISGKANERVMIELTGMADTWLDDSVVNTPATMLTTTLSPNREFLLFSQLVFTMNDQDGDALASPAADIYIQGFEINLERPTKDAVTTQRGNLSDEFLPSAFMTGTIKLDFSVAQEGAGGNVQFLADQIAGVAKKAKLVFTAQGAPAGVTAPFEHVIWLPNIFLMPGAKPAPSEPGAIAWSMDGTLHHVGVAPTGFDVESTDIITHEILCTRATDPLA